MSSIRRRPRKNMQGDGLSDIWKGLKKAHNWIKKNKIISRGASALAPIAGRFSSGVSRVGDLAAINGYGKRKRRRRRRA